MPRDRLSFSSDHVNYLILRYLQESRFPHAAFAFAHECRLGNDAFEPGEVPPGALIHLIQKGLQFVEMEANVAKEGNTSASSYTFFDSKELMTRNPEELRQHAQRKRQHVGNGTYASPERHPRSLPRENHSQNDAVGEDGLLTERVSTENVISLKGHTAEVVICSWSPTEDLLASGSALCTHDRDLMPGWVIRSGDASARIWPLDGDSAHDHSPVVLSHSDGAGIDASSKSREVPSMDWSPDGSKIATGCYNGLARIWSKSGALITTFRHHRGPIFSLKWSNRGTYLLSGGADKKAFVWDPFTGDIKQCFACHSGAVLDVDWKNSTTFATCSTDKAVHVHRLGEERPVKSFLGHEGEVNAIKWDPRGELLASCSDDGLAKIWTLSQDIPAQVLNGHTREIYTVRWQPGCGSGENGSGSHCLATASFDATVKLWDLESGHCKHNLTRHSMPVYTVAFSPDGKFLATGSSDKSVLIWSVAEGRLVKSFTGKGGIYEVCWNRDGTRVAACSNNKLVTIIDMRM